MVHCAQESNTLKPRRLSWSLPVIAALASILFRLPFLVKGAAFFNSDEAVEGLMARHIREWPVFLWGQDYKGVPEVYLSWAVFSLFGVGVIQLKAVTLGVWAAAVAVTTRLGQRWYGNAAGWVTGTLLATGPPSLVLWSLSANAEVAWLTLLTAGALLGYQKTVDEPARGVRAIVFVCCGAALWVQPIAVCAVAALALVAALRSTWWRERRWEGLGNLAIGRDLEGWRRGVLLGVHLVLVVVAATFVFTYAGGRFHTGLVTASHPQKVFRLLVVLATLTVVGHALTGRIVSRRRAIVALGWLALGLLPVIVYIAAGGSQSQAIYNHDLRELPALAKEFIGDALPTALGVQDSVGAPLTPWWLAIGLPMAIAIHVAAERRAWSRPFGSPNPRPDQVFGVLTVFFLLMMLFPGGTFIDVNSYRYLMPFSGLAALSAAAGLRCLAIRTHVGATLLGAQCLAGFLVGDYRWYERLTPDDSDRQIISCLSNQGIHAASAGYWVAYRMTFLAGERIIVASDENERRPVYRTLLRELASHVRVDPASTPLQPGEAIICSAPLLRATVETTDRGGTPNR